MSVQVNPGFYPAQGEVKGRIAVLIESHYDEAEFNLFNRYFPERGYEVEYVTNLWGQAQLEFFGNDMTSRVSVSVDVRNRRPSDYVGIILIGGYAMDRLRYEANPIASRRNESPAVQFLRGAVGAMDRQEVVIGAICHSLWLFTADETLISNRRVTCAHNVIYDVKNAGATVVFNGDETADIIVDGALVTAKHPGVVEKFAETVIHQIETRRHATI